MVGDVTETVTVSWAVEWSEVVINALDPGLVPDGSGEALADATARIVAAMAACRVRRHIGFGSPVLGLRPRDVPTVRLRLNRWVDATVREQEYRQMRGMLEAATTTDVDWTIVRFTHRSRRLNRGPSRGLEHMSHFAHEAVGSAATATDLARFAVDQVLGHRFIGAAPAVSC